MKSKKGFMLAEIIIVSTIVMIGLVSLFTMVNKMFIQYDKRVAYDTVDATYVSRGLAENYSKDMIEVDFDDTKNYLIYETSNKFLQKNNVVRAYISKYKEDSLEELLVTENNKLGNEKIESNFYDYIEKYKNSNDFSDSAYVNQDENEGTYNYIIFTEISDECENIELEDGTKIKKCTEDNGNISFGYYKFSYIVNRIESTEDDEIENVNTDIKPPKIKIVSFVEDNRLRSVLCEDGSTNCVETLHDIIGQVNISWELYDEYGSDITEIGIKLCNEESNECKDVKVENINESKISINMLKDFEEELPRGLYYIKIYAVDSEGNSGQSLCDISYSSNYCKRSENVEIYYRLYFTEKPGKYGTIKINNTPYYGGTVDFTVGTQNVAGMTVTLEKFNVIYNDNDEIVSLPSEIDTTVPGNYSVPVYKDGYITTTTSATTNTSSGGNTGCLVEGTKVLLANGKYKNVEDIDYNDLLAVFDHETGKLTYQYSGWLEKPGIASNYTKVKFSDGTSINFTNNHAIYSLDYNEYITIYDKEKFKIGSKVAKYKNNKVEETIVTNIENIDKEVKYYHILSNRHFNVIANDLITVNKEIFVSNFHGFKNDLTWKMPILKENIYSYEELSEIPYYLYKGLRLYEGKFFINYGMDKTAYLGFLKDFILNENKTLKPKINKNGKREWMVTTSDDVITEKNKLSYLMEEGDYYTLKEPIKIDNKKFIGWHHTGEATLHQPGEKVEVLYGTHFIAKWDDPFNIYNGSDNFEKFK